MTTKPAASARVTVLGLGRMGTAASGALLAAGWPTVVWNRTAERTNDLVRSGAVGASDATEAVTASPVVIITLADYQAVREVLGADPGALAGRHLINLTTGTPDQARSMATWAGEHGASYVDGAMMAVPQTVATPDAFFLYSGSETTFQTHREILDQLATSYFLGIDPAAAELWDLALLGCGYAALTGFLHSLALLDTMGVSPSQAMPLIGRWLQGMIAFMPELGQEVETGEYQAGVSPVGMNRVAVANLVQASVQQGVSAEVTAPLRALLDRRVADGHGNDSFASLYELLRWPVRPG